MAWSAGLTLLILVVLGGAVYAAVSGSLADRATAVLADRAEDVGQAIARGPSVPDHIPGPGPADAGTLTYVVGPNDRVIASADVSGSVDLPDADAVADARENGSDVRTETVAEVPIRVYSDRVDRVDGVYVVQVVGGRQAEQQLLGALLLVLVAAGLVALLLAVVAGYVYAGRALVPIRASIARRDEALHRQREFAANASHELRTPLTVIRTSITDLRRNADQPVASVGTALDDIDDGVAHLTALVDDLLVLARADSGGLELDRAAVDLADTAAEAVGALGQLAATRDVRVVVDPLPTPLHGDPLRLRQLVTILVDNAIAHSPAGGTVTVRVRPSGDEAELIVEDDGPGIRASDLPRIFDRFWRADDAPAGGTGLGLAIAAWIVERHGGSIGAENRPTGGARLTARLPLSSPAEASPPAAGARDEMAPGIQDGLTPEP